MRPCVIYLFLGAPAVLGEVVGRVDEDNLRVKFSNGTVRTWPESYVTERDTVEEAEKALAEILKAHSAARKWA
jgi:hypothetical protein